MAITSHDDVKWKSLSGTMCWFSYGYNPNDHDTGGGWVVVDPGYYKYHGYQSEYPDQPYYRAPEQPKTLGSETYTVPAGGGVVIPNFQPDTLLDERGHTHGEYKEGAKIIQATKDLWRAHPGWQDLNNCQRESFDMFATKAGRILAGDQNCLDSWADISGYAQLIVNMLKK